MTALFFHASLHQKWKFIEAVWILISRWLRQTTSLCMWLTAGTTWSTFWICHFPTRGPRESISTWRWVIQHIMLSEFNTGWLRNNYIWELRHFPHISSVITDTQYIWYFAANMVHRLVCFILCYLKYTGLLFMYPHNIQLPTLCKLQVFEPPGVPSLI